MLNKKIYIGIISVLSVIILTLLAIIVWLGSHKDIEQLMNNNTDVVDLRYGDSFKEMQFYDIEGNIAYLELEKKINCVFYLASTCHSCTDILNSVEKIQAIFGTENVEIMFVWSDVIPQLLVEQYNLDKKECYKLNGEFVLSAATPSAYILDENGTVVYLSSDIQTAIEKLYDLNIDMFDNTEQLKTNANDYLMKQFDNIKIKQNRMIYFKMEGCPDCVEADVVLQDIDITDNFKIMTIYKYDDTDISHIKDDYALFRLVYGIKWYPSFLVLKEDGDYSFVGQVPIETLKEELFK